MSGGLGAFLTTWWTKRAEREEGWRERLIAAAQDFHEQLLEANAAWQGAIHILKVGEVLPLPGKEPVSFGDQWSTAVHITNRARRANGRLVLIFGLRSEVGLASAAAINAIDGAEKAMKDDQLREALSRDEWFGAIERKLRYASERSLVFADVAHEAIWARPRRRPGESFEAALLRTGRSQALASGDSGDATPKEQAENS